MLSFIATNIQPDIVVWTGDTVPHNFWDHTLNSTINHVTKISNMVNSYLGSTSKIFPTVGNHDIFPMNQ
jgi:hypothetical protein